MPLSPIYLRWQAGAAHCRLWTQNKQSNLELILEQDQDMAGKALQGGEGGENGGGEEAQGANNGSVKLNSSLDRKALQTGWQTAVSHSNNISCSQWKPASI